MTKDSRCAQRWHHPLSVSIAAAGQGATDFRSAAILGLYTTSCCTLSGRPVVSDVPFTPRCPLLKHAFPELGLQGGI